MMGHFGHNNESSGSTKGRKFYDQLTEHQFLKRTRLCGVHEILANNLKYCLKGRESYCYEYCFMAVVDI
jgi:hypothetical protein